MCFLFACFSTIRLHSFIDAFFIDKKIDVRDETFVVSGRCRRLLAFIVDSRCRRPTFRCWQSMRRQLSRMLTVDVEDLPFVVSSRCGDSFLVCWQSM